LFNLVNLPEITEPLYKLCSVGLVKFHVRKVVTQDGRAGISTKKEHELGFAQM